MLSRIGVHHLLSLITALGLLGSSPLVLAGDGHSFEVVDSDAIYFGEGTHPKTPAVILCDEVWGAIPEYKKILDDDLSDDDPKYHQLMKKATERFQKALSKVAKREGYDMIGEEGSIAAVGEVKKEIPDATKDLVDAVGRD